MDTKEARRKRNAARARGEDLFPEIEDIVQEAHAKGLSENERYAYLAETLKEFMERRPDAGLSDSRVRLGLFVLREVVIRSPAGLERRRAKANLLRALRGVIPASAKAGGKPKSRFAHDNPREFARLLWNLRKARSKRNDVLQAREIAGACNISAAHAFKVLAPFRRRNYAEAAYALLAERHGSTGSTTSYMRRLVSDQLRSESWRRVFALGPAIEYIWILNLIAYKKNPHDSEVIRERLAAASPDLARAWKNETVASLEKLARFLQGSPRPKDYFKEIGRLDLIAQLASAIGRILD